VRRDRSKKLFARAKRVIPGGVNSPVRAYGAVGGTPPFLVRGRGAGAWGGGGGGGVGSLERGRRVSSGTEAAMSAVRLARAATGRERLLKFDGGYHGHADALLLGAGSGVATLGIPGSPGIPQRFAELSLQAPYNDLGAVASLFERYAGEIACVLVEPVAGNMGCILPEPGFLEGLAELCRRDGALLVFDEVITGFRVAYGGAQERFGIRPDLTILGKILGGGLPAAAFGGRAELIDRMSPVGPVYQAGTLSGNPLAMAAGG